MSKKFNLQAGKTIRPTKMPETLYLEETSAETNVVWKIKNFFPATKIDDHCIESSYFIVCDAKLQLLMYPNFLGKYEEECQCCLSVVLSKESTKKYSIKYTVGIKKLDGSVFRSCSEQSEMNLYNEYGRSYLVETSILQKAKNKVSRDNSLTVFCTISVNTPGLVVPYFAEAGTQTSLSPNCNGNLWISLIQQFQNSVGTETLTRNMEDLLLGGKYADVIFQVKDKKFQAHKAILSTRSPVFGPMFEHDMIEKESGVVNIDDCEPEIFHDFLIFCYSGTLQHVTSDNAPDLYKLADKYDLKELKAECSSCMGSKLSVDSFCEVVLIASLYNDSGLLKTATRFFIKYLKKILPSQNWRTFLKDHHLLANELLIHLANKN